MDETLNSVYDDKSIGICRMIVRREIMVWNLDADRPIYSQLVEKLQLQIISGHYPPGGKLPSVRELAAEAAVNPNTMQKAFAELERGGLIVTQSTNGRTVTEDTELLRRSRLLLAQKHVDMFLDKMRGLGYTIDEAIAALDRMKGGTADE
ncbi:HTH-type transcriptional repressor YtrA [Acetatifactor muris]|jgi:GntR family transcriptional regulator|uniref:HTH-type transcriptional repressor YtrA n=2 Tax=Acetatifactor muris TaxID=879566 RepID=A0A2K4ZCA9_9FIRM|nr:GntR family transcriptional regulator [Acetatifactor muris]SOY28103.1 HTH-type transcriptional repressor YtrA [Acetatifactor muris]